MPATDAADRLAIMEVASRYETTFDRGELDAHMAYWSDTLFFTSPYMGTFETHDAYRTGLQKFYDDLKAKGGTRHLMTNFEIDLDGDAAYIRSYLSVFNRRDGAMLGVVEWQDDMVRIDSRWLYRSRTQIA